MGKKSYSHYNHCTVYTYGYMRAQYIYTKFKEFACFCNKDCNIEFRLKGVVLFVSCRWLDLQTFVAAIPGHTFAWPGWQWQQLR